MNLKAKLILNIYKYVNLASYFQQTLRNITSLNIKPMVEYRALLNTTAGIYAYTGV